MRLHWRQMAHRLADQQTHVDYLSAPRAGLSEEERPALLAAARLAYGGTLEEFKRAVDSELAEMVAEPAEVYPRLAEPESAAPEKEKAAGYLPESWRHGG